LKRVAALEQGHIRCIVAAAVNRYFGSIVAIGEGADAPIEHCFVRVRCRPMNTDLTSILGDGIVQTVISLPQGGYRFEVIVHACEPLPKDVLHWVIAEWRAVPTKPADRP
jgi:hypothetical protein